MTLDRRVKWDKRFLKLAEEVASWSKDPSTKVGAIIVDKNNIVQGQGYNGFPRGVRDLPERYENRELKLKYTVHAELNSILNAKKTENCRIYVWPTLMKPDACPECAKAIVQSGINEIVYYDTKELSSRWEELSEISRTIFDEAGVRRRAINE